MVARLSIGKKDLESSTHYQSIAKKAVGLSLELLAGSNKDSDAFAEVNKAYGLPKETDEQKTIRNQPVKTAMTICAQVPLHNAALCRQVLELCRQLTKSYNQNASSDLECAQLLAEAGLTGCAANVRVNLPYLKDESYLFKVNIKDQEQLIEGCLYWDTPDPVALLPSNCNLAVLVTLPPSLSTPTVVEKTHSVPLQLPERIQTFVGLQPMPLRYFNTHLPFPLSMMLSDPLPSPPIGHIPSTLESDKLKFHVPEGS